MQETRQGSVTLVLGGVRSGKSRYAQQLAEQSRRVVFVATAKISDDEMRAKIERHREDRPKDWLTVEEPLELAEGAGAARARMRRDRGGLPDDLCGESSGGRGRGWRRH